MTKNANPDDDDKKFTQKDLDKYAAREKKQGRRSATRDLMQRLGFDTVEETEDFIKEARDKVKPSKRSKERNDDKPDDDKSTDKAKERERKAAAKELDADIRMELISAGAPRDKTKLATLSRMIDREDLGDDPDEDDIADAVEELKETWPKLFESEDDDGDDDDDRSPDASAASEGGRRKRPGKKTGWDRANDRFERNHGKIQSQ